MLKKTRLFAITMLGLFVGYFALQAIDTNQPTRSTPSATATLDSMHKETSASATIQTPPEKNVQIDMKKLSEAVGHYIGRNLKSPALSFETESIIKGIREGVAGQPSPLNEKEYEEMMAAVQEKAFKEISTKNLKNANEFMEKNQKVTGVIEIVPGKLQYQIVKEGTGPVVEGTFSPKINYTGKYHDGTQFGTSADMGGPITIPLNQTIPGFSKGIVGMKEGETRRLFVHPDLGYGTSGQLPPNELLIFEIDLVKANAEVEKPKTASAGVGEPLAYEDDEGNEDADTNTYGSDSGNDGSDSGLGGDANENYTKDEQNESDDSEND